MAKHLFTLLESQDSEKTKITNWWLKEEESSSLSHPDHIYSLKNKPLLKLYFQDCINKCEFFFYQKELGTHGKAGFYSGRVAKAIAEVVQLHGGIMTTDDLASHVTTFECPISADYKGYRVWEVPPNGQGITTLMALNILEGMDLKGGLCNTVYHHFSYCGQWIFRLVYGPMFAVFG